MSRERLDEGGSGLGAVALPEGAGGPVGTGHEEESSVHVHEKAGVLAATGCGRSHEDRAFLGAVALPDRPVLGIEPGDEEERPIHIDEIPGQREVATR